MSAGKQSIFKRYSILLLILILVGAAYYFLKIQQNESQQNQRYLRQLNEAAKSLQQSVSLLGTSISEELKIQPTTESNTPAKISVADSDNTNELNKSSLNKFKEMINATQNFKHLDYTLDNTEGCKDKRTSFCMRLSHEEQAINVYKDKIKITTPIADLIPSHFSPFPLLIISDKNGNILAEKHHLNLAKNLSDLRFSNVKSYISNESDVSKIATTSASIDREVSGLYLRIYRQPIKLTALNLETEEVKNTQIVYLLAFVEKQEVVLNNLKVSNTAALWAVLSLILLVAILPILKIQYCAPTYSYSRSDVSQFILGLFILIGVLAIAISDQLFYRYWLQQKSFQTDRLFHNISENFRQELGNLIELDNYYFDNIKRADNATCNNAKINEASKENNQSVTLRNCTLLAEPNKAELIFKSWPNFYEITQNVRNNYVDKNADDTWLRYYPNASYYFIENWFLLGKDSYFTSIDEFQPTTIYRPHNSLYNTTIIPLSGREYYQRGWHGSLWNWKKSESSKSGQPFFIQRIRNIHDARFNSQLVFQHSVENNQEKTTYLSSIGTSLTSLNQLILPKNFGFAVINQQGQALYHSNEERSLVENFFAENVHNLPLLTTIEHLADLQVKNPAKLEVEYRHAPHNMTVGKLHEDIPDWALVVFYNQEEASQVNMLLVFLAVILYLLLLIPLVLLSRYLSLQGLWARILHYQHDDNLPYAFKLRYKWLALWIWSACIMQLFSMAVINNVLPRLAFFFFTLSIILIVLQYRLVPVTANEKRLSIKQLMWRYLPQPSILFRTPFFIPFTCGLVLCVANALLPSSQSFGSPNKVELASLFVGLLLFVIASYLLWRKTAQSHTSPLRKNKQAHSLSVLNRRVSMGYLWYLAASIYLITMVPAVILINSVNGYMLQGQATFQNQYLQEQQQKVSQQATRYRQLMGQPPQNMQGITPTEPPILHKSLFPGLDNTTSDTHNTWLSLIKHEANTFHSTTDPLLTAIISNLYLKTHSAAEYQFMAANNVKIIESKQLHYYPARFMQAASNYFALQILVITVAVIMSIYYAGLFLVSRKLLGEHIFDSYRLRPPAESENSEFIWQRLKQLQISGNMRLQFISQLSSADLETAFHAHNINIYKGRISNIEDWLNLDGRPDPDKLAELESLPSNSLIAIQGLAQTLFNSNKRIQALSLLKTLQQRQIDLVIVSEVSPMLLLSQAENFPDHNEKEAPSNEELWQWSKLLRDFAMHYHWVARKKSTLTTSPDALSTLMHESTHWPELKVIRSNFITYHRAIKLHQSDSQLTPNIDNKELQLDNYWSPQQIIEFFVHHARPAYRLRWEQCSTDERLTLLQLAHGAKLNPANVEAIGHLQRRGLIYRDCGWHLVNESFRQFILSAEPASQVEIWVEKTQTSLWQNLRAPLFMLVAILFFLVIFSANIAFDSVLSTLAAVLGVAPLLIQNLSSLRSVEILPK